MLLRAVLIPLSLKIRGRGGRGGNDLPPSGMSDMIVAEYMMMACIER